MKQIFFSILLGFGITALFTGCENVNDQFHGLDDNTEPTNVAAYTYTLTSANYTTIGTKIQKPITDTIALYQDSLKTAIAAHNTTDSTKYANAIKALKLDPTYLLGAAVKSNQYLTGSAKSDAWVPLILNSSFIYGDVTSTANVTYNYNLENVSYLSTFKNATAYTVSNTNYSSVGGKVALLNAFTPSYPAKNFIPGFLAPGTEGSLAVVTYNATTIEPELADIPTVYTKFSDDFEGGDLSNFVTYNVEGTPEWAISSYGGTSFAKISGFVSGTGNVDNEDWLILPSVDLSSAVTASISFKTAHKYAGNNLALKYSTDYSGSGDPSAATWNDLAFAFESGTGTYAWTSSGSINIPGMPSSSVSIAFVYTSTTSASSTWEIDNVAVTYKDLNSDIPVQTYNDCYRYSSSTWAKASDVVCVSPFEYEAMGISGNCFTSSTLPATYLPTYLKTKYPLAVEGDTTVVIYNYGAATTPAAAKYTYTAGVWSAYTGIITKTDPFAYSTSGWVYDPTVRYSMVKTDYQMIVDYFINHKDNEGSYDLLKYVDSYKTAEYYYGASGYYGEFNVQISYRKTYDATNFPSTITDDAANALIAERVKEGLNLFLQLKYPSAVTVLNGIEVHYVVTAYIYNSVATTAFTSKTGNYSYEFKCTADGTSTTAPSFEYVSGPTLN